MVQQQRMLVALAEDPGLVPRNPHGSSQPPVTLVPEGLAPTSGLQGHQACM